MMVEADGLTKAFDERIAVDDLSFRIMPGKVTGFLGPNGSGKSTTLRLMLGLDRGSGSALFDGRPYREILDPVRRVGALLDGGAYHPARPARDHLRMVAAGSGIAPGRVDEVLETVGLASAARRKPKRFSLGMGQRLGLATALLGRPDLLILDEPANGLDPQGIRWLRDFLRAYAEAGNTVFLASHLLSEMELVADHLIVIAQGRLVADASVADFIRSANLATVVVGTRDRERLSEALRAKGGKVRDEPDDRLVVSGLDQVQVADIAAGHGCFVFELFTKTASLEESFLRASRGLTEFDATAVI